MKISKMTFSGTAADERLASSRPGRPAGSKWEIGSPIAHYYQGPGVGPKWGDIPEHAGQLAELGFNLVWCSTVEDLDAAHALGLRGLSYGLDAGKIDQPGGEAALDAYIDNVKDHPAMYGYWISDEPSAAKFPELGRLVAYIRKRDPAHVALINLFPTYATPEQLGILSDQITDSHPDDDRSYREYLRQFVEIVKPDLISYDHYHFLGEFARDVGSERSVVGSQISTGDNVQYFLNLALVREAALGGGVPFVNVVQACANTPGCRTTNGDEGRFLAYTTLAYGGQGIAQFVYQAWEGSTHWGGVVNVDGTPTSLGKALPRINAEFVAIGTELQPLTSLGVYHLGAVPLGALGLPADARFTVDPPVSAAKFNPPAPVEGMLLGYYGANGNPTHVLVVNLDYTREVTTTVVGPGSIEVFDAGERHWHKASDGSRAGPEPSRKAEVILMPGGGKLLRLRRR